jgi:hypothetical protein
MCHWLGTTGLKFIASRLYSVTYTCRLTCLCFFLSVFFFNPGIKELELAAGKDRKCGDYGCPLLSCGKCDCMAWAECRSVLYVWCVVRLWEMFYCLYSWLSQQAFVGNGVFIILKYHQADNLVTFMYRLEILGASTSWGPWDISRLIQGQLSVFFNQWDFTVSWVGCQTCKLYFPVMVTIILKYRCS